jgi:hypothetical protein
LAPTPSVSNFARPPKKLGNVLLALSTPVPKMLLADILRLIAQRRRRPFASKARAVRATCVR